jgi:flagellar hook-associated protein 1 FlgK
MSISGSLSSALSGLNAAARGAELVSNNVANATNPSYARRELQLGARVVGSVGQGVAVLGTERVVNQTLLSDRRIAEAGAGGRDVLMQFHRDLEGVIGTSADAGAISGRIAGLESALVEAASRPDSEARLANLRNALQQVTTGFRAASDAVQQARARADTRIGAEVRQLNASLVKVQDLNVLIRAAKAAGNDASGLMDQRQKLVDDIATIVPIREIQRDNDQIALITAGGATLLDGKPATFGFTSTNTITADMTLASGALSGLTLNGRPIAVGTPPGAVDGGTLAAQFAIRDDLGITAQASLDAVARNLIERLEDPALDTTRAPGSPGLLTDGGAPFNAADEVGLAARLAINPAADPDQGGALWRLRDGLGAVTQGPPGNSALLSALHGALTAPRPTATGPFATGARSFAALVGDLSSLTSSARIAAESDLGFARARADSLAELQSTDGVDTDQELQKLLTIEQAYAANARVIQTVDDLIQILIGL